jgi:hypothetical protein
LAASVRGLSVQDESELPHIAQAAESRIQLPNTRAKSLQRAYLSPGALASAFVRAGSRLANSGRVSARAAVAS